MTAAVLPMTALLKAIASDTITGVAVPPPVVGPFCPIPLCEAQPMRSLGAGGSVQLDPPPAPPLPPAPPPPAPPGAPPAAEPPPPVAPPDPPPDAGELQPEPVARPSAASRAVAAAHVQIRRIVPLQSPRAPEKAHSPPGRR